MKTGNTIAIVALISLTAFAGNLPLSHLTPQHTQANDKIKWKQAGEYIAGTPASRRRAAKKLGFDRGRWIIAYFSAYCLDCDKIAVKLNELVDQEQVLGLTIAPTEAANRWKQELGIKYRVLSVSERMFEDLGAVILPTVVLFEDGEAKGAYAPSMGEKK
jgi:thiol-disulfide isomerase/thioredoxin